MDLIFRKFLPQLTYDFCHQYEVISISRSRFALSRHNVCSGNYIIIFCRRSKCLDENFDVISKKLLLIASLAIASRQSWSICSKYFWPYKRLFQKVNESDFSDFSWVIKKSVIPEKTAIKGSNNDTYFGFCVTRINLRTFFSNRLWPSTAKQYFLNIFYRKIHYS